MKKLKKSVKIVLISVVSVLLVAGIVLGCVFGLKSNNPNNPNPNNPTPSGEVTLSWNEKIDLLGQEINNKNSQANSYDVILGAPYENYVTPTETLYDLSTNYFITQNIETENK